MSLDELIHYTQEQSLRGDLARELTGILNDYQGGTISSEDKQALITEVMNAYQASDLAHDEVMWRWAISAATAAVSFV